MTGDLSFSQLQAKCTADDRLSELSGELNEDLVSKLNVGGSGEEEEEEERENLEKSVENDGEDDEQDEDEFSFASIDSDGSLITAEEAFQNGLIRPVYPVFDRNLLLGYEFDRLALSPPLRKVFVKDQDDGDGDGDDENSMAESSEPQGPYCSWSGKTVVQASPESCRKSSSTGFSRLWRFRDLLTRSTSDGKDAFVFINSETAAAAASSSGKERREKGKGKKEETAASAHEKLYVRNRANREEAKRRSYLPYKNVGFFTDVHGLSKNIHPF